MNNQTNWWDRPAATKWEQYNPNAWRAPEHRRMTVDLRRAPYDVCAKDGQLLWKKGEIVPLEADCMFQQRLAAGRRRRRENGEYRW